MEAHHGIYVSRMIWHRVNIHWLFNSVGICELFPQHKSGSHMRTYIGRFHSEFLCDLEHLASGLELQVFALNQLFKRESTIAIEGCVPQLLTCKKSYTCNSVSLTPQPEPQAPGCQRCGQERFSGLTFVVQTLRSFVHCVRKVNQRKQFHNICNGQRTFLFSGKQ